MGDAGVYAVNSNDNMDTNNLKEAIGKHNARILNEFQKQMKPDVPMICYDERVALIPAIEIATEQTLQGKQRLEGEYCFILKPTLGFVWAAFTSWLQGKKLEMRSKEVDVVMAHPPKTLDT